MAVTKRTRFEVLKRDNHTCRYCGGKAPDVVLTVDHVLPVALGGTDDPTNLVAACKDCNAGKSSTAPDSPLVADVEQKALEWGRAIEEFNRIRQGERQKRHDYTEQFCDAWVAWGYGPKDDRKRIPTPSDWKQSIWQFYATGLPIEELKDAVDVACGNRKIDIDGTWRYMCGVAWRKVEEMHAGAKALLEVADSEGGD